MPPSSSLLLRPAIATAAAANPAFVPSSPIYSTPQSQQNHHQNYHKSHLQNSQHFSSLLKSYSSTTHFLQLHTQFVRNRYFKDPLISLNFLTQASLVFAHKISHISRVFGQIAKPDRYHYNVMIRVLSKSEFPDHGVLLYKEMRGNGVVSDAITLSFCLKCCAKRVRLIEGMQIHRRILEDGHFRDCILTTSLMELYKVCGKSDDACKVFDEMPVRDTIAYNGLISCFLNHKRTRDTLVVFDSMLKLGAKCRPDTVTCLMLLQACARLGALDFGKRVWEYVEKNGYEELMNLNNTLIDMYSNCGAVEDAYKVFERMPFKNLVSWTTMISGLGMNGFGKDGVKLFRGMQEMGIAPDDRTLTAVLYACSQSGLLNEGFEIFENMSNKFGISPNTHHYGCATDILGRLGLLEKAYYLILSMPGKPDAKIWRTLLAACRTHKAFQLAEQVVEHIVELKALEAGDYILLLNTFSSNKKWDKVKELRMFMRENNVMTTPGRSTLELEGVVHEFLADDTSHPRNDEIYEMLHEILQQLKIAGYAPQISSEMHDLDAAAKEKALVYHSEKLAIAFGVLSTPPGTTIRVANSVRLCGDCHEFGKVFSAVYNRKVIIRDRNRVHLFRKGYCSCGDCW